MRFLVFFLSAIFAFSTHTGAESQENQSARLMAEAIALLQEHKKDEALQLLEKAFEFSQDASEIQIIGALIIEASPLDYERRDAYLRYLVTHSPNHKDYGRWTKELGDRAFDKADLAQAEDWYLRALNRDYEPRLVKHKLAWVFWNQNRKTKAFSFFLEAYSHENEPLKKDTLIALARLWIEIGQLPQESVLKIRKTLSDQDFSHVIHTILDRLNEASIPFEEKEIRLLQQLYENSDSQSLLRQKLDEGFFFSHSPCFFFEHIRATHENTPAESLLRCVKQADPKSFSHLKSFFESRPDFLENEALIWAYLDFRSRSDLLESAQLGLKAWTKSEKSPAFAQFLVSLILKLSREDFQRVYFQESPKVWKRIYMSSPQKSLLLRLQSLDSAQWIQFEESQYKGQEFTKEFLIRKAIHLASKNLSLTKEQVEVVDQIFQKNLSQSERQLKESRTTLLNLKESELPLFFDEDFQKSYLIRLETLDHYLTQLRKSSPEWKKILENESKKSVKEEVDRLNRFIERAKLPEEWKTLEAEFENQKLSLKSELKNRYRDFLTEPIQAPDEEPSL